MFLIINIFQFFYLSSSYIFILGISDGIKSIESYLVMAFDIFVKIQLLNLSFFFAKILSIASIVLSKPQIVPLFNCKKFSIKCAYNLDTDAKNHKKHKFYMYFS